MLKKKFKLEAALTAIVVGVSSLASCNNTIQQDPWFNTSYFQAGTYYFKSIEGTNTSEDIIFDESSYFVCTPFASSEEEEAYDDMIREETPNGLWACAIGEPRGGDLKFEWFNCYFANMPSMTFVSWMVTGQCYNSTGRKTVDGQTVRNEWYYDYQDLFDSGKIKFSIATNIELHEENDVLTEARVSFYIPDVCDLVMYFSFVAAS